MENDAAAAALSALTGLLDEFHKGHIVDARAERAAFERQARVVTERWDRRFPGFPTQYFPFTSFKGENYRGKRDAYLKDIIVRLVAPSTISEPMIVNPACVFGRHSRDLARRLPSFRVIGTDIDWHWNWWYELFYRGKSPGNFEFRQDDIFQPQLAVAPTAVVFFGACGSVSDSAIDYAIDSKAPYLMCRTCCHDNIGGNTVVTKRPTYVNRFFRFKNHVLRWMRRKAIYSGFYFSPKYSADQYPRSTAARSVLTSQQILEVARHSPDSDVCRAIIDLDRYLFLREKGYEVWYQGELFVARKVTGGEPEHSEHGLRTAIPAA